MRCCYFRIRKSQKSLRSSLQNACGVESFLREIRRHQGWSQHLKAKSWTRVLHPCVHFMNSEDWKNDEKSLKIWKLWMFTGWFAFRLPRKGCRSPQQIIFKWPPLSIDRCCNKAVSIDTIHLDTPKRKFLRVTYGSPDTPSIPPPVSQLDSLHFAEKITLLLLSERIKRQHHWGWPAALLKKPRPGYCTYF